MSPFVIREKESDGQPETVVTVGELELVGRNCKLQDPKLLKKIDPVDVDATIIAYASPDSTYAVTKRLLDGAKKEIVIGIYDFSADYMKDILLNAMQRGVKVALMLDIDSAVEQKLFNALAKFGCDAVPAPSCASKVVSYFPSSHEKVIVIDETWCLVQSGNYSANSIPLNEKDGGDPAHFVTGNRDMGVAIQSPELAKFFKKVLRSDMKLETDAASPQGVGAEGRLREEPDLVEAVPESLPKKLFPSKTFELTKSVSVQPVLSPDSYMRVIPGMLESATKSILIEQQYIRSTQSDIVTLLEAIKTARGKHPQLQVRIILGKLFSAADATKEVANVANMKKKYGLKLGDNIRYIDTKRFVHCHNKLIVVDGSQVLVSSQNWSNSAVSKNREAGVLFTMPAVAKYFTGIFDSDWETAFQKVPKPGKKQAVTPEAVARGGFLEVRAADYQEV
ncbi:MAG: phospholipase D-like domain-containing protein [Gemmatimonadaceae bacterium]